MGILWRDARDAKTMRAEYDAITERMKGANLQTVRAFLQNIRETIDPLWATCASASRRKRNATLSQMRFEVRRMWDTEDWPLALGAGIACLNVESCYMSGRDAAFVRAKTDKLIGEADSLKNWNDSQMAALYEVVGYKVQTIDPFGMERLWYAIERDVTRVERAVKAAAGPYVSIRIAGPVSRIDAASRNLAASQVREIETAQAALGDASGGWRMLEPDPRPLVRPIEPQPYIRTVELRLPMREPDLRARRRSRVLARR